MKKPTEATSKYDHLELMSAKELLEGINQEDQSVAFAVQKEIPSIEAFIDEALVRMKKGGRLFYIGAGTSGRLGVVDASECPPTFGVAHGVVVGIIAGGDKAIRKAVEFAEDDTEQGWLDLCEYKANDNDILLGIAASGGTPYVIGAILKANQNGLLTAGISCNPDSILAEAATYAITPIVGPEFVTGSTRMKSGTAQKMVLNMISTALMIQLGHVKGNKMVDMQLSNNKLVERGTRMVCEALDIQKDNAKELLIKHGSVRAAIKAYGNHQ
ncbi:MAG: N-acetylmuramic acid 6-phosphate etherase [Crocinitomicaceae bacterium]|jgi:N-acetylmuramic acid 6-phosphate etherase|tara:strand:- start:19874 stop:20686 length:813 start_codon:yes stop_codon:yes gene_type:complete